MRRVLVVGAGAAGLLAGCIAAREGAEVHVFEKMNMVGKKMGITGKGRCNITNAGTMQEMIANTPGNGKFLFSAYQQWTNEDLLDLLHSWGLETKVERGNRVFPQSDSALEVRDTFLRHLKGFGATVHMEERVLSLETADGAITGLRTDKGHYTGDAVIIATGGKSYPLTGSTGDGYELAASVGHTITELRPSLVPVETKESWVRDLMGLSLRNVSLSVIAKGKVQASQFGEMMFTHFGITGPIVLSLSHTIGKLQKKGIEAIELAINLKPALTEDVLDKRLQRDFLQYAKKQLGNGMKDLLPARLIPIVIAEAGLSPDMPINQLTKEQRRELVDVLQRLSLTFTCMRPIAEAIVTAGGVSVKEVNPKTMESKLVRGLYFAGEVLDVDAYTGGYNLQAAFSTGYVAAMHAIAAE